MNYKVNGTSFCQDALNKFYKDDYKIGKHYEIKLVCEEDNPYDSNAIAVYLNSDKIGYIPKVSNVELKQSFGKIKSAYLKSMGPNYKGIIGAEIEIEME